MVSLNSVGSGIEDMVSNANPVRPNQNCPFLELHPPTRRKSDRVAIHELIDPRFGGYQRDMSLPH